MVCPKCKAGNPAGAKFCEKCGARLGGAGGAKIGVKFPQVPGISGKLILPLVGLLLLVGVGIFGYQRLTNNPEAVTKKFLTALGKKDLTTALAQVVPEERLKAKADLDSFLGQIERFDIKSIKVKDTTVTDDEATVDVQLDYEIKLKSGEKFTFLASKGIMIVYDGKTKVEVPITEAGKYSQAQDRFESVKLEKIKGKWYIKGE